MANIIKHDLIRTKVESEFSLEGIPNLSNCLAKIKTGLIKLLNGNEDFAPELKHMIISIEYALTNLNEEQLVEEHLILDELDNNFLEMILADKAKKTEERSIYSNLFINYEVKVVYLIKAIHNLPNEYRTIIEGLCEGIFIKHVKTMHKLDSDTLYLNVFLNRLEIRLSELMKKNKGENKDEVLENLLISLQSLIKSDRLAARTDSLEDVDRYSGSFDAKDLHLES
jgi:hypothetical protein